HVAETPRVQPEAADRRGLLTIFAGGRQSVRIAAVVVRLRRRQVLAGRERTGGAGAARVLPFRLGRQAVAQARTGRVTRAALLVERVEEALHVREGDALHRTAWPAAGER